MSDSTPVHSLDALVEEFLTRLRAGEVPDIERFAGAHPQLASQIRELFPALIEVEAARTSTLNEPRDPLPPMLERVGDYRLLRLIGRGGMGTVYEAEQESLGRRVALKLLPYHAAHDPLFLERFRREARAAANLHHSNIVPVFGVGEDRGVNYYAMQFIPGEPLDVVITEVARLREQASTVVAWEALTTAAGERIAEPSPGPGKSSGGTERLSRGADYLVGEASGGTHASRGTTANGNAYYRSVAVLGLQLADALAYAHGQGIMHRDIKPSNLLLDPKGQVWITDFGLAKAGSTESVTATGDFVGTLRYMAPERFKGQSHPSADTYALGLTLYEMLALRPAFPQADRAELVAAILREQPPPLRQFDSRVPRDLETIITKACEKEPSARFGSAAELAEELRRYLSDQPLKIRPLGILERFLRWRRHHRTVAHLSVATALLLLLLAAAGVLIAWSETRSRARASRLRAEAESSYREAKAAIDAYARTMDSEPLLREERFRPVLRELLASSEAFYGRLVAASRGQPGRRVDLADASAQLGRLQSLYGSFDKARQSYAESIEADRQILASEPDRDDCRLRRARSQWNLGTLLISEARHQEARQWFVSAIEDYSQLIQRSSQDLLVRGERARAIESLAQTSHAAGEAARALTELEQARSELASIPTDRFPVDLLDEYASVHGNLARLQLAASRLGEARQNGLAALRYAHLARDARPHDPLLLVSLAENQMFLGDLAEREDDASSAEEAFQEAQRFVVELIRIAPLVSQYRYLLAKSHLSLGILSMNRGEPDRAERSMLEAQAILQTLALEFPSVSEYRIQLAHVQKNLGVICRGTGRKAETLSHFRAALETSESLMAQAELPTHRLLVMSGWASLATAQHDLEDLEAARTSYGAALETHEKSPEAYRSLPEFQREVMAIHLGMALLLSELDDDRAAAGHYQAALELGEELVPREPDRIDTRENLAEAYTGLGFIRATEKEAADARDAHEHALRIRLAILERLPDHPETRNSVAGSYVNLAGAELLLNNPEAAADLLVRAEPHHAQALAALPNHPTFRQFYRNNRILRIRVCLQLGDHAGAALAANDLAKRPHTLADIYHAARETCRCVQVVESDATLSMEDRQSQAERYRDQAANMLLAAIVSGFQHTEPIENDQAFQPIFDHPRYQEAIEKLSK